MSELAKMTEMPKRRVSLIEKMSSRYSIDPEKFRMNGNGFMYNYGYRGRSVNRKIILEHILIVENVIGYKLPKGAEVHHVNEKRDDNQNKNLVVCPNRSYHQLLHVRQKALMLCGNPNWRSCVYCKKFDDPSHMVNHGKGTFKHRNCATNYERNRRLNHE